MTFASVWDRFVEVLVGDDFDSPWEDAKPTVSSSESGGLSYGAPGLAFRQFARGFVDQGEALDLLYRSGAGKGYPFCSWIPDWTADGRHATAPQTISTWRARNGQGNPPSFFQAADTPSQRPERWGAARTGNGPRPALQVPGRVMDRIRRVASSTLPTAVSNSGHLPLALVRDMQSTMLDLANHEQQSYPTGEAMEDVMIKLPIGAAAGPHDNASFGGVRANRDRVPSLQDAATMLADGADGTADADEINTTTTMTTGWEADLKTVISSVHLDADVGAYASLPHAIRVTYTKYWETAVEFARRFPSPHFAVTERGYLGVVPDAARPGDAICVFPGGRVPFLLRQRRNSSVSSYELIGECYVHGIMFGEGRPFANAVGEVEMFSLD
ncbi:hypothetical protein B0T14DRAFT_565845 [Immersiella caudata]|uniref:Uncharacterized protein n=1 Tax=Immersiella caudata TaxID=314043 RepID=A0AA39WP06_9PEZI|nr:hypothetical protein B0T14DRAFT_565845 [Immersiella caudata]